MGPGSVEETGECRFVEAPACLGIGSASRHAVGTGVMGGMIAATAFGIFFTPLFYFAARKWLSRASVHHASDAEEPKPLPPTATPDEGGTAHA